LKYKNSLVTIAQVALGIATSLSQRELRNRKAVD
jgi:hypothetical protein